MLLKDRKSDNQIGIDKLTMQNTHANHSLVLLLELGTLLAPSTDAEVEISSNENSKNSNSK